MTKQLTNLDSNGVSVLYYDLLPSEVKESVLRELQSVDIEELVTLKATLSSSGASNVNSSLTAIEPMPLYGEVLKTESYSHAYAAGEDAIRSGKLGILTVAGGQGTRLGFQGPKGMFPVTPIKQKTLFHVFAEKITAAQEMYGLTIPWYLMTSPSTHEATVAYFRENCNFGLNAVYFFKQGTLPFLSSRKELIVTPEGHLGMSPNGHGGVFEALATCGLLRQMKDSGIEYLSYFQVDNPLVAVLDPYFIGFHVLGSSEMSSKVIQKEDPSERVGLICKNNDKVSLVEYCDFPQKLAQARDASGKLMFSAGSIAVHVISRSLCERMSSGQKLPYHVACKQERVWTPDGPKHSEVFKFERFIFDALRFAKNPLVFEVRREEAFAPVKNSEGVDSPDSCKALMQANWAQWLIDSGEAIELDNQGYSHFPLEISPKFADNSRIFIEKWTREGRVIKAGTDGYYIE